MRILRGGEAAFLMVILMAGAVQAGFVQQGVSASDETAGVPRVMTSVLTGGKEKVYKNDEILVKFKTGASEEHKKNIHAKHGSVRKKEFPSLHMHHLKLKKGVSVADAIKAYSDDPEVEYAEPDFLYRAQLVPNDPLYSQLWGLAKINAPAAWDSATGSNTVVVGVIDTGIDYNHPDLAANIWTNPGEVAGNSYDDDSNGYVNDIHGINAITGSGDPMDDNNHGTHVAGTIGATGNNGTGVVGVNWNVKIIGCKFLDAAGYGDTSNAIECLQYFKALKNRGINIVAINNSWGGTGYSQALSDAIDAQRDILFIAAAGNNYGRDNDSIPTYPAGYKLSNVISVAATNSEDNQAYFTNIGRRSVHVAAPGDRIYSTLLSNTYGVMSGTSMATPHVTGLAALLKSKNPAGDWREMKNLLLSGGDAIASMEGKTVTGRRINANDSLNCSGKQVFSVLEYPQTVTVGTPATISALSINCGSPVGSVTAQGSLGTVTDLYDDGVSPDLVAGDGIFTGTWTPERSGDRLTFASAAGTETIAAPPMVIQSVYLPDAIVNTLYSQRLEVNGGLPPYNWSLLTPLTLPSGLSFNAETGEISGAPTTIGMYTFTIEAADSLGSTVTSTLRITVTDDLVVEEWAKTYDMGQEDWLYAITHDSLANVLVSGTSYNSETNSFDVHTIKYDSGGNLIWRKTFHSADTDVGFGMTVDGNDNVYVIGRADWTALILKYDRDGNLLQRYDSGGANSTWDGAIDQDGNLFVLGQANGNYVVMKYSPAGTLQWTKPVTGWSNLNLHRIAIDKSGNLYLAGKSSNGSDDDFLTIKFDSAGNLVWSRNYNQANEGAVGIATDGNDNVYVVGYTYVSMNDVLLVKYDSSGTLLWANNFDSGSPELVTDVAVDVEGNAYVLCDPQIANHDFLTVKFDPSGNVVWTKLLGGRHEGVDLLNETSEVPQAVMTGPNGAVYVAGWFKNGSYALYDYFTVKFVPLVQNAPEATISGTPSNPSNTVTAILTVGGAGIVAYKYKLGDGSYSAETPVATPISLGPLGEGAYTVSVLGKDSAGNWQETPTVASWTVDLTPPVATVSGVPANPTRNTGATLTVGGADVVAYRHKLNSGEYSAETPVADPIMLSGFTEGIYTVSIIGRDAAGNWQATPTTATWSVDLPVTAPGGKYARIQEAYNSLSGEGILEIEGTSFFEDLSLDREITVTLRGGCDHAGGTCNGITSIFGSINIIKGTVITENLAITSQP